MDGPFGYRLYRGPEFCRLSVGFASAKWAEEEADEAIRSGWFDRAEITENRNVIKELKS